jgi:hypothetical protein
MGALTAVLVAVMALAVFAWLARRSRHRPPAAAAARTGPVAALVPAAERGSESALPHGVDERECSDRDAATVPVEPVDLGSFVSRFHRLALDAPVQPPEAAVGASDIARAVIAVLDRVESQPRYMPRRPHLLPRLMQAINDPDASARRIAEVIGQDPALAGTLLRIANSPLHRVSRDPVESIERAVTLLGTDGLRPIVAAALLQPVMDSGQGPFTRFPRMIWDHSLLTAAAAAEYARVVERTDPYAAQLLGLLHGLGAIVVVQVVRDEYARQPDLVPDPEVAAALLEPWAMDTARRIATGWGLTERTRDALTGSGRAGAVDSPLARSLQFGRTAGALALLCRAGELAEHDGRAMLAAAAGGAMCTAVLWERLYAEDDTCSAARS